jgi:hypothetical protein
MDLVAAFGFDDELSELFRVSNVLPFPLTMVFSHG